MLYRISVAERGLTGIANIFRSRLSGLNDRLRAGTVPLTFSDKVLTSSHERYWKFRVDIYRCYGQIAKIWEGQILPPPPRKGSVPKFVDLGGK